MNNISDIKNRCTGCGACIVKCPVRCIQAKENNEGFLYPEIDDKKCTECGLCNSVCPVNCQAKNKVIKAFAGYLDNDNELKKSSSGGIFYAIASKFIENGGVVFGAVLNNDTKSVNIESAETIEELKK